MADFNKVVGIGMSRTGTTTLQACFRILRLGPHKGHDGKLKSLRDEPGGIEKVLRAAEPYRSFQDSPWYRIYPEFDRRFPQSKFILTTRATSSGYANSSWWHGVRKGRRDGPPTEKYLASKAREYEAHNQAVLEYFRDRHEDLLVVCWEKNDGWTEICDFLGLPVPDKPIPHRNKSEEIVRPESRWIRLRRSTLETIKRGHDALMYRR